MIVRDLDGYGTAPTVADVLESVGSNGAPLQPEKFNKRERFSILFDELFALQSVLSAGVASVPFYFASSHQGHVLYLGTAAADASNGKGSVYVVTVSDENVSNLPTIALVSRVLYTDD
jgi:hypothetical protein